MINGIDVSHYQGVIDWRLVKPAVSFAYIKATEDTGFIDPRASLNCIYARTNGIPFGVYHFMRHGNVKEQVEFFQSVSLNYRATLPPMLDVEASDITVDEVEYFLHAFPGCILYADFAMLDQWGDAANALTASPLWIAAYVDDGSPIVKPWPRWTFWQHSPAGRVPGITTPVDLDRFNGTVEELHALIDLMV